MVTISSDRGLAIPTVGGDLNQWGSSAAITSTNPGLNTTIYALDQILGGTINIYSSNGLSQALGSSQSQFGRLVVLGTIASPSNLAINFPSSNFALGNYQVWNNGTGGGGVLCQSSYSSGTTCTVPTGSMRLVNSDGVNVQFSDAQATAVGGGLTNKFRNPAMDVAQRALPITPGTGGYTLDGWIVGAASGAPSVSQAYASHVPGNALRITGNGAGMSTLTMSQRIESSVAVQLLAASGAQAITVQFTIYNNSGNSFTPQLQTSFPTARDNWAGSTPDLAAVNLQACPNASLTTVSYTFTPNVGIANGYQVSLLLGSALNSSAGTVDITMADIRATPGVVTGLNGNPPIPEMRPIHTETLFCQRYAFVPPVGWGYMTWTNMAAAGLGTPQFGVAPRFPATMRIVPSLTGFTFHQSNITALQQSANAQTVDSWSFDMFVTGGVATAVFWLLTGVFTAEL